MAIGSPRTATPSWCRISGRSTRRGCSRSCEANLPSRSGISVSTAWFSRETASASARFTGPGKLRLAAVQPDVLPLVEIQTHTPTGKRGKSLRRPRAARLPVAARFLLENALHVIIAWALTARELGAGSEGAVPCWFCCGDAAFWLCVFDADDGVCPGSMPALFAEAFVVGVR